MSRCLVVYKMLIKLTMVDSFQAGAMPGLHSHALSLPIGGTGSPKHVDAKCKGETWQRVFQDVFDCHATHGSGSESLTRKHNRGSCQVETAAIFRLPLDSRVNANWIWCSCAAYNILLLCNFHLEDAILWTVLPEFNQLWDRCALNERVHNSAVHVFAKKNNVRVPMLFKNNFR